MDLSYLSSRDPPYPLRLPRAKFGQALQPTLGITWDPGAEPQQYPCCQLAMALGVPPCGCANPRTKCCRCLRSFFVRFLVVSLEAPNDHGKLLRRDTHWFWGVEPSCSLGPIHDFVCCHPLGWHRNLSPLPFVVITAPPGMKACEWIDYQWSHAQFCASLFGENEQAIPSHRSEFTNRSSNIKYQKNTPLWSTNLSYHMLSLSYHVRSVVWSTNKNQCHRNFLWLPTREPSSLYVRVGYVYNHIL